MKLLAHKATPYQMALQEVSPLARRHKKRKITKSSTQLSWMVMLGIFFIAVFAYLPMFGLILAFKSGDGYGLVLKTSKHSLLIQTLRTLCLIL